VSPLLELVVYMTLLTFAGILCGAFLRNREWTLAGLKVGLSNREQLPPASELGARAERAAQNTKENFILFVALALTAQLAGVGEQATFGAQLFFCARLAYLPVYWLGITYLRSAIWGVGIAGLGMMVLALLG
jgi:uncharacterized MAPEG superfamily protein